MKRTKFRKPEGFDKFVADIDGDTGIDKDVGMNISTNANIDIDTDIYNNNNILIEISKYNKKAMRKKMFNLRLNDYYLSILKGLSNPEEGVSMQDIVFRIVAEGLDKRIEEMHNLNG